VPTRHEHNVCDWARFALPRWQTLATPLRYTARPGARLRQTLAALRVPHRVGRESGAPGRNRAGILLLLLQIAYALLFTGYLFFTHTWPAPDVIAVFLLCFALLAARGVSFLRDWSPFIVLLLGYVGLTGIVTDLEADAHIGFPIAVDRLLFHGVVPTLWLQNHLYTPGHVAWYDYLATFLYPMHFVVPLVLAFCFWMWRKTVYWQFVVSYLVLCYAGFLTYLLFPMAPPWWAADAGQLRPVHAIINEVTYGGVSNPMVLATQLFKPNPVAAMPSLHAAFPVLVWLVLWRLWPRWGWIAAIYPLAMTWAVVYLGEHYVIDCLVGFFYAGAAFALVWCGPAFWRRLRSLRSAAGGEPISHTAVSLPIVESTADHQVQLL
jgi:PAP2 superfamily